MKKILAAVLMAALAAVMAGCATDAGQKGPSDHEQIQKVLLDFKAAGEAASLDKLMALISPKFSNSEYGDKDGLKTFLQDTIGMGYLSNASVNVSGALIKVQHNIATAAPLELKASFGSATIELQLAKDGTWAIVGMDVQQY